MTQRDAAPASSDAPLRNNTVETTPTAASDASVGWSFSVFSGMESVNRAQRAGIEMA